MTPNKSHSMGLKKICELFTLAHTFNHFTIQVRCFEWTSSLCISYIVSRNFYVNGFNGIKSCNFNVSILRLRHHLVASGNKSLHDKSPSIIHSLSDIEHPFGFVFSVEEVSHIPRDTQTMMLIVCYIYLLISHVFWK